MIFVRNICNDEVRMNFVKIIFVCEKVVYVIFVLMDMSSVGIDVLWYVMCINMIVLRYVINFKISVCDMCVIVVSVFISCLSVIYCLRCLSECIWFLCMLRCVKLMFYM